MQPPADRPVLIAITTFRRVELLGPLLDAVNGHSKTVSVATRVAVIDNDPDRSAERTSLASGALYVHQPIPGIAATRQRALDLATAGELVAMIDDDVLPEDGWLMELLSTWRRYQPTVVMGYIRYVWPADADPWVAAGGFMRRTHHSTGTSLPALATGNVLVDVDQIKEFGVRFDTGIGLFGGEDTVFGRDVLAAGGTIVASAQSIARDDIPADRATRQFARRRMIAHGENVSVIALADVRGATGILRRAQVLSGAVVRWVVFAGMHFAGKISGDLSLDAVGARRMWFAQGRLRGAIGRRRAEYAR